MLCCEHYNQSADWQLFQLIMNIIFTIVFACEAVLKIYALRLWYFRSTWNWFDFIIATVSIVGLLLDLVASSAPVNATALRVLRILRVGRAFRVVRRAQDLRRMLTTLVLSGPALLNIGMLLFLVLFIYAIVGMNLFGHVVANGAIDDFSNFRNFGNAMVRHLFLFSFSLAYAHCVWLPLLFCINDVLTCNRSSSSV